MSVKLVYIAFFLSVFCFAPLSEAMAGQAEVPRETQFFSVLQDMPLMPGLVELADQTVVFDKPEGRIIESVAQIHSISEGEIRSYYESVLPQFGWSRIDGNAFVRGDERLQLSFEDYEDQSFLRIMVMPGQGL